MGYDVIACNLAHAPAGAQLCGYTTGTPGIRWTSPDWSRHPGAVRICQDATASDWTADVLDVERGAATIEEAPGWARRALSSHQLKTRRGQRTPLVYVEMSRVTPLANVLTAARLATGQVGLFIADWNEDTAGDILKVMHASGPFPIHGWQAANRPDYDVDIFSAAWLASGA